MATSIRALLYEVLQPIATVKAEQDLKGHIAKDTLVIQKMSPQSSMNTSVAGWITWVVYIYTPSSPMTLDRLAQSVRDTLYKEGFEITNGLGGEYYDADLKCYTTAVTCRNPSTINFI